MKIKLQPDNRSARYFLTMATLGVVLLGAHPLSKAAIYGFTEIETNQGLPVDGFIDVGINNPGDVVYSANLDGGGRAIFVGNGGAPDLIIDTSGDLTSVADPSINDHADVGLIGTRSAATEPIDHVVLRYNKTTGTFTKIAETGAIFRSMRYTAINNASTVAFSAYSPSLKVNAVAAGMGGAPVFVDAQSPNGFGEIVIKVGSSPPLEIAYPKNGPSKRTVLKGNSLPQKTLIVDSSVPPFEETFLVGHYSPSIDFSGNVAFTGRLTTGVEGVFVGDGVTTTTVVDASGGFDVFRTVTMRGSHTVFEGRLDFTGTWGLYSGPSPIADKVVEEGDSLPGYASTVTEARIRSTSMNNSGQVAMIVDFANGRRRVLRADPLGSLVSIDEVAIDYTVSALTAADNASISQVVDVSTRRRSLMFDYLFATTSGKLKVRLGGRTLATIVAPRRVAARFSTFAIHVNPRQFAPRLRALPLEFVLHGGGVESGVMLDNIRYPGVRNGDFQSGNLRQWESQATRGGVVGVAVAPGSQSARHKRCAMAASPKACWRAWWRRHVSEFRHPPLR